MIGYLKGVVGDVYQDRVVIDVQGVGYIVFCNEREKSELSQIGSQVKILIHSITKEDGTSLYGFIRETTRTAFVELIKISGVSGKIANTILSHYSAEELQQAILSKEEKTLTAVPGIGKKLANRIINECKTDNLGLEIMLTGRTEGSAGSAKTRAAIHMEATSGLVNIGIKQEIAKETVAAVIQLNPDATTEEIIKISIGKIYER